MKCLETTLRIIKSDGSASGTTNFNVRRIIMDIIVSIDDTDSIDSRGTGELAEMIASFIENNKWGITQPITRHQLLLHKDIPYTSHNSSMCFKAEINQERLQDIIDYAADFLKRESEPEADPGLCIVVIDNLRDEKKLIDFGQKAKRTILTKEDAWELAKELNIHLSEHGGTGQGIIGALSGAGLRLSGNDGWIKGSHKINSSNNIITAKELCSYKNIDKVRYINGSDLEDNEEIMLGKLVKPMLIEGEFVVLVDKIDKEGNEVKWKCCSKQQLMHIEELKLNVVN